MHARLLCALSIIVLAAITMGFTPARSKLTVDLSGPRGIYTTGGLHVAGPTAYMWPGSITGGESSVFSFKQADVTEPSIPSILASTDGRESQGSLVIGLNFTNPCAFGWNDVDNTCASGNQYKANFTGVTIYVPPEFDLTTLVTYYNPGLIQTTFGANENDVGMIWRAGSTDPWGPGWWVISVYGDIHWWPQHDYREWYYLRINGVIAPKIAGRYFLKVFLYDQFYNFVYPGMPRNLIINGQQCAACNQGPAANPSNYLVPLSGPTNATVPIENWPTLLVKGEIDPAIVTGAIRYGSFNTTLYGNPIDLPGRVRAVGVAIDPYKPGSQSTGRPVEARGYFNSSVKGRFEVEGLAAGLYDFYASAAGYPEQLIASQVLVLPGQSFHLDGYVNPGPVIHGQVFSKHLFGEEPWPSQPRPVYVEIYSNSDYSSDHLAAFSPLNFTHQPYMAYDWDYLAPNPSLPTPKPVSFPWAAQAAPWAGSYYSELFLSPPPDPNYNSALTLACGGTADVCSRPNGVGPAQYWWVDGRGCFTNGGGTASFIFRFGAKGVYGAPAEFDGHVPQSFASWVNGLRPGRYWVRVWINGYVQTLQDGTTISDIPFGISDTDWAGDIFVPVDLRVASSVDMTVHFHGQPSTMQECPIDGCVGNEAKGLSRGNRFLIAELRDSGGTLVGMNFTYVLSNESEARIEVNGFGMIGPDKVGIKYSYFFYQSHRDYGIPAGTYQIYLYMRGYLEDQVGSVSVTLSGSPAQVSAHMYRGARLNFTIYSIDWEQPHVERPWEFPGAAFRLYVADSRGRVVGYVGYTSFPTEGREGEPARQPACYVRSSSPPFCPTGSPQITAPNDMIGSTITVNSWDGRIAAESDTPGIPPGEVQFGGGYTPPWNIGGFLIGPYDYRNGQADNFTANDALPTGTYSAYAFTYGYVQRRDFTVYALAGSTSDVQVDLLRGVNITLNILFKEEGIFRPTEFNMSMRVRVFDQDGNIVATASSKGPDNANLRTDFTSSDFFGLGRFTGSNISPVISISESYYADPFTASPAPGPNPQHTERQSSVEAEQSADTFLWHGTWPVGVGSSKVTGWESFDSDPNLDGVSDFGTFQSNVNFWGLEAWKTSIPYNTDQVRVFLAGIYDPFGDPLDAFNSGALHTRGWKANRGEAIDSMFYGIIGFSPDQGYSGPWYVEIDCWNEYAATHKGMGVAPAEFTWHPPAEGLLEGDGYHIIPGGKAGAFGFTGTTLRANGLGPYAQGEWSVPSTQLGASLSAEFSLARRSSAGGPTSNSTVIALMNPTEMRIASAPISSMNNSAAPTLLIHDYGAMLELATFVSTGILSCSPRARSCMFTSTQRTNRERRIVAPRNPAVTFSLNLAMQGIR
jgi:hypothetical protein